ncbi:hypothetical protein CY34DRAFT_803643 [Suillus luteus UH-Slu-Lm8-n1]|uniref:Unplaced genomic scaffold CY34scaffold_77, whole genome shotgun sequence n=1 Tax=Suillus luteus UH-Slu-Lm8-n1 TaxID=930992 RepID=A0A0D0B0U7_9AGAM|nr:hypothetical protein CY34DRAFT_803643 [Suillus luteus UH-Slu-Lm8-n1]
MASFQQHGGEHSNHVSTFAVPASLFLCLLRGLLKPIKHCRQLVFTIPLIDRHALYCPLVALAIIASTVHSLPVPAASLYLSLRQQLSRLTKCTRSTRVVSMSHHTSDRGNGRLDPHSS